MQLIRSLALTFCLIGLIVAEQSPVFLWGAHSVTKPSLQVVSSKEFAELVTPLLEEKALVVFMEKGLSPNDFLRTNNGKSCYARLQDVSDKTYYTSVDNPVKALRTIGGGHYAYSVDKNGKISKHVETDIGNITFLDFNDEEQYSDRDLCLKLHDSIIASVSSRLGENVFFMYVSSPSTSLKRQRRQVSQDNTQGYVFRNKNNLLLYYKSLTIREENNPPTLLDIKDFNVNLDNATAMSVTLTPTNGSPLTFDITLSGGYFFMENLMYNNAKLLSSNVYAPTDFSYFCGNLTLTSIPNNKQSARYTLKWDYLQFQAPFGQTTNESFAFGDAWHCVGFFTGGILSGLLIVALLLTITFIGVCWMMDINTMDRFDDPKGKTITINASD